MSRYIDADALKESLKDLKAEGNNQKYVQGLQDAIDDYFPQIIDDAPTADVASVKGWISIGDRLPEPETWVMVYIEYPSPVIEIESGIKKTNSIEKLFYDGKGFYNDYGSITHWRALPEPPKKKSAQG